MSEPTRTGVGRMLRFLAPYLTRFRGAIGLAVLLGAVSAFGLRAPILLIGPFWGGVLFPSTPADGAAVVEEGSLGVLDGEGSQDLAEDLVARAFEWVRQVAIDPVFGPATTVDEARLRSLWTIGLLLIVVAVVAAAATYAFHVLMRRVALSVTVAVREDLARHLLRLSLGYHGDQRFGTLISHLGEDVNKTLLFLRQAPMDLVMQPLLVVASLAVSALAAPLATLLVVLLLMPLALPFAVLGKRVRRRSSRSLDSLGSSVHVLTQMLQGIRTVKAFRAEDRELERYGEVNRRFLKHSLATERAVAMTRASTISLNHFGTAVLVVGAGWFAIRTGAFRDPEQMMQFLAGLTLAYTHVRRAVDGWTRVQESSGAADRLTDLLAEHVEVTDRPGARDLADLVGESGAGLEVGLGSGLRFEGVSFRYPRAAEDALADVDLDLPAGGTLALVGASGAGKTTLVDLVARFLDPTRGRIVVDGVDLRDVTLDSWTERYAMVGQSPFLFHATIAENIRYGKPTASDEELLAAARAANVHEFVEALPDGYDTLVGQEGARLSGGQRQRITIARALLKGAPLLLLDEATSALDSESEQAVQEALGRLMRGRTVIVIAHRLSTVRDADRIVVLDGGRVVEQGTHESLVAAGGNYARLHAVQYGLGPAGNGAACEEVAEDPGAPQAEHGDARASDPGAPAR